jgi:putative ABC transport system ATP-binding protein
VTPLVVARDLKRAYHMGDELVHAVRGVSLDVDDGEYLAVVGPSGCGKSTLLNLLGGIDRPSDGSVEIGGDRVDKMRDADATRFRLLRIGFVFQRFYLMPALTALENVELPLAEAKVARRERISRARELLAYVGLGSRLDHRPAQLSGGEQQRVAIARALSNRPKLILADEPTGNLDSKTGRVIVSLLHGLARSENTTIVAVTHDLAVAQRTDMTYEMEDGKLTPGHGVAELSGAAVTP